MQNNTYGRTYKRGAALSSDYRQVVIDYLLQNGSCPLTAFVPRGLISKAATALKVSRFTVSKMWNKYCDSGNINVTKGKGRKPFFNDGELELIETLLREKPTMHQSEIGQKLQQYSDFEKTIPNKRISFAIHNKLPSGPFTYKQVSMKNTDRFSDGNIRYTQAFITFVSQQNPRKLKFFDESGFKISTGNRTRGYSELGTKCIEIGKNLNGANVTLNLLVSLAGIVYFNFIDGASTTETFVNFWYEANESLSPEGGATLEPGDIVILDNCPIHKNEGEDRVSSYLARMGIQYLFLPTYSPDLNPAENCFSKLKSVLKMERFQSVTQANVKVAVGKAMKEISTTDIEGYFRYTGYINMNL